MFYRFAIACTYILLYLKLNYRKNVTPAFSSVIEYEGFVQKIIIRRNNVRSNKLSEEIKLLKPLPENKFYAPEILELTVTKSSTIRIDQVTYSVPSRASIIHLHAIPIHTKAR